MVGKMYKFGEPNFAYWCEYATTGLQNSIRNRRQNITTGDF